MKILVTAGATREPLDEVRFISNVSSGRTGAILADALAGFGHDVALLRGEGSARPQQVQDCEKFSSCADLLAKLQTRLGTDTYDAVVMTAAVADYRPDTAQVGKIRSDSAELAIRLVRNPKILPQLKSMSKRPLRVIGFKFTVGASLDERRAAVLAQWASGGVDATVLNDLHEIQTSSAHPFYLWGRPATTPILLRGAPALAAALNAFWSKD
jgi:phosphopantothenoylcysteine decarboxylase/phosphopantothenate--cysteine ligase